ncbi:unnamed protein product [Bursaphelenchus okinawaensis]|uniref:WAP domain-containing protein n=1 Tax=Bursaphelenchus okinawaensis TaxID=465554 RepID=A0A811KZK6_9BILA|nr:unnamed protein product [Bursaphelenchus okinawaensis]CAG9114908.1 unnamed protein product [Bursaphelenchus okinawaensis]
MQIKLLYCVLIITIVIIPVVCYKAECNSSQMCPLGWSVLRREDGSAHTCDPSNPSRSKCPKRHTCVAAKCGIKFCCINDKMSQKLKFEKEIEEEMNNDKDDEL